MIVSSSFQSLNCKLLPTVGRERNYPMQFKPWNGTSFVITYDQQRCLFGIQEGKLKSVGDRTYADKVALRRGLFLFKK